VAPETPVAPRALVTPAPRTTDSLPRGVLVIDPPAKRPGVVGSGSTARVEGSSSQTARRQEKGKGVEDAPALSGPVVLPGSKIDDPDFIVTDVVSRYLHNALRLPPRFSLPIQAIYSHFHEDSWNTFAKRSILDRQRLTVTRQISVRSLLTSDFRSHL